MIYVNGIIFRYQTYRDPLNLASQISNDHFAAHDSRTYTWELSIKWLMTWNKKAKLNRPHLASWQILADVVKYLKDESSSALLTTRNVAQ